LFYLRYVHFHAVFHTLPTQKNFAILLLLLDTQPYWHHW